MSVFTKQGLIGLFAILVLCGCGYRFAGGGRLPEGMRTVHISVLGNRTGESGLDNLFTNDVIYEFTRSGIAEIVPKNSANGVITGELHSMRVASASRANRQKTTERTITVVGSIELHDQDGDLIRAVNNVTVSETYLISDDDIQTETNRRATMALISKRFAERVYQRLTDEF